MIKINLVPEEILAKEQQQQRYIQFAIVAGLLAILLAGASAVHWIALRRAEAALAAVSKDYKENWADIGAKLDAKKKSVEALKTRLGVITDLLKGRSLYPHFMADIARAMPPDIWVTNIATVRDSGKSQVKVTAQALSSSAPGITRWLRAMEKPGAFGSFGDPVISAISAADDPATNGRQYSFTLTFTYVPGP